MATMEMDETKIKMFVKYVESNLYNILNNERYKVLRKIGILASGGKDSLALLDICLPILERRDIEYDILHIVFPEKICKYASMTEHLRKYLKSKQRTKKLKVKPMAFVTTYLDNAAWDANCGIYWKEEYDWFLNGQTIPIEINWKNEFLFSFYEETDYEFLIACPLLNWESNGVILDYLKSKDISLDETIYYNKDVNYIQEELWKGGNDTRQTETKKLLNEKYNYTTMLSSRKNEHYYVLKNLEKELKKLGWG